MGESHARRKEEKEEEEKPLSVENCSPESDRNRRIRMSEGERTDPLRTRCYATQAGMCAGKSRGGIAGRDLRSSSAAKCQFRI